ncbi:MAG: AAA family ATPase [Desulfovibrio sp.]
MKISIRDFAPIKEADIALDGLTVIAGDNDTGKSTVGKLVFSLIKAANRSRKTNAAATQQRVLLRTHLNLIFGRDDRAGTISLFATTDDRTELDAEIGPNGDITRFEVSDNLFFSDAILIETPVVWQLFDTFQGITAHNSDPSYTDTASRIKFPYSLFNVYQCLNGSVPGNLVDSKSSLSRIECLAHGRLVFSEGKPNFRRNDKEFPIQSVATGIQALAILQRLLELGLAVNHRLLILDEPEVHMHPKWQLEYAKLLVSMVDELGMSVLMTTHSPVFVEAMEFVGKKKLGEKCHFYLSERMAEGGASDPVVLRDVTEDLDPVYEKLAHPLMQLSLFQGDA